MSARRSVLNIAQSLRIETDGKTGEIGLVLDDARGRAIVTYWLPPADAAELHRELGEAIVKQTGNPP